MEGFSDDRSRTGVSFFPVFDISPDGQRFLMIKMESIDDSSGAQLV